MFPKVILFLNKKISWWKKIFEEHILTMVWPSFLWSRISHKSIKTASPMATTVKIPLTLEPQVQAMKTPVRTNQVHHSGVNSLNHINKQQGKDYLKPESGTNSEACGSECKRRSWGTWRRSRSRPKGLNVIGQCGHYL
jgi:hypothetical protein